MDCKLQWQLPNLSLSTSQFPDLTLEQSSTKFLKINAATYIFVEYMRCNGFGFCYCQCRWVRHRHGGSNSSVWSEDFYVSLGLKLSESAERDLLATQGLWRRCLSWSSVSVNWRWKDGRCLAVARVCPGSNELEHVSFHPQGLGWNSLFHFDIFHELFNILGHMSLSCRSLLASLSFVRFSVDGFERKRTSFIIGHSAFTFTFEHFVFFPVELMELAALVLGIRESQ